MGNLISLELYIQKKYIKIILYALGFITLITIFNKEYELIYFLSTILGSALTLNSIEVIFRDKFDITMYSMGISKTKFVFMKFLMSLVYVLISNIIGYGIYYAVSIIFKSNSILNYETVVLSLSIAVIFSGVILMTSFILGYKYHKISNFIMIFLIVNFVVALKSNEFDFIFYYLDKYLIFIVLFIYALQYFITKSIYKRKDV